MRKNLFEFYFLHLLYFTMIKRKKYIINAHFTFYILFIIMLLDINILLFVIYTSAIK